jgi:aspartyl-tRNA(Asn)/glutamyl-tRNA(Gln) amidotransferase subunit C
MPSFSSEDVRRLASLARLELSDAEVTSFARQLGDILEFARQVQRAGVPAAGPGDAVVAGTVLAPSAATREDDVRPSLPRQAALAQASEADPQAGLFKVPRVFNG